MFQVLDFIPTFFAPRTYKGVVEDELRSQHELGGTTFITHWNVSLEERIYKESEVETAKNLDGCSLVDAKLDPYKKTFNSRSNSQDILRLLEIQDAWILKFNKDKADELIQKIKAETAEIDKDLGEMVRYQWIVHPFEGEIWLRITATQR